MLLNGLRRVHLDPGDLAARLECQMGTWQSLAAANAGVGMGLSHAIGHALGGTCNVPHGYTSCVMLPYVMEWNASVNAERQALISACFNAPGQAAAKLLDDFIRSLGMPRTLRDVGVGEESLPLLAKHTLEDIFGRTNPRVVRSVDDIMPVLHAALG
jgi:maleylacetate reductase